MRSGFNGLRELAELRYPSGLRDSPINEEAVGEIRTILADATLSTKEASAQFQDRLRNMFLANQLRDDERPEIDENRRECLCGPLRTITLSMCGRKIKAFRTARRELTLKVAPPSSSGGPRDNWHAVAREPTPHDAIVLVETIDCLLTNMKLYEERVVSPALRGFSTAETSAEVGRSEHAVRGKHRETGS